MSSGDDGIGRRVAIVQSAFGTSLRRESFRKSELNIKEKTMTATNKPGQSENAARDDSKAKDVRQQQHTGNHEGAAEKGRPYGADAFGGTRAGAENVEKKGGQR